jgi:hypothetical protein
MRPERRVRATQRRLNCCMPSQNELVIARDDFGEEEMRLFLHSTNFRRMRKAASSEKHWCGADTVTDPSLLTNCLFLQPCG